jgi:glycosyltransferase involved in cell wall biosynthesis
VVAFDISSNPEIVAHNETGFLVSPMDIPAFTNAVTRLASDPVLCEKLGNAGRKRVEELFEMGRTRMNLEMLLRDLTGSE